MLENGIAPTIVRKIEPGSKEIIDYKAIRGFVLWGFIRLMDGDIPVYIKENKETQNQSSDHHEIGTDAEWGGRK